MSKVHANLPNKNFDAVNSGLATVSVCMDCGKLASELCSLDVRGSRVQRVQVVSGTAPTETCSCHVPVQWCTEGDGIATEFCPADHVVQKSAVDYVREGAAAIGSCRDEQYHLAALTQETVKKMEQLYRRSASFTKHRLFLRSLWIPMHRLIRMYLWIPMYRLIRMYL